MSCVTCSYSSTKSPFKETTRRKRKLNAAAPPKLRQVARRWRRPLPFPPPASPPAPPVPLKANGRKSIRSPSTLLVLVLLLQISFERVLCCSFLAHSGVFIWPAQLLAFYVPHLLLPLGIIVEVVGKFVIRVVSTVAAGTITPPSGKPGSRYPPCPHRQQSFHAGGECCCCACSSGGGVAGANGTRRLLAGNGREGSE